jgi:hypothetical protein
MKKIIFIAILISFCIYCKGQSLAIDTTIINYKDSLQSNKWWTDEIVGLDPTKESYELKKQDIKFRRKGGNYLFFTDSVKFISGYSAMCGNDYFTSIDGNYQFIDKNKIMINVHTVSFSGEWKKPTEHREPNNLTFIILSVKGNMILSKQK